MKAPADCGATWAQAATTKALPATSLNDPHREIVAQCALWEVRA